jgi:hypothetical protein
MWRPESHRVSPRNAVWLHNVLLVFFVNGRAEQKTNITIVRNGPCEKTELQGKSVSEINC